ncbi:hypothetical protein GCM10027563_26000 [Parasphingorhabdus pacifica]
MDATGEPEEIRILLFPHGVESIGLAGIEEWLRVAARAGKVGSLVGVDESAFPRDFAGLVRAHRDLYRIRRKCYPMPRPLRFDEVEPVLRESPGMSLAPR